MKVSSASNGRHYGGKGIMRTVEWSIANRGRRGPVSANESGRRVARRDKRILLETATEFGCFGCGCILERKPLRSFRFRRESHALCIECERRLYEIILELEVRTK